MSQLYKHKQKFDVLEEDGSRYDSPNSEKITWKSGSRLSTNKRRIIGIVIAVLVVTAVALAVGLGVHYSNESKGSTAAQQGGKGEQGETAPSKASRGPTVGTTPLGQGDGDKSTEGSESLLTTTSTSNTNTSTVVTQETSRGKDEQGETAPSKASSGPTVGTTPLGQDDGDNSTEGSESSPTSTSYTNTSTVVTQETTPAPGATSWLDSSCQITTTTHCPGSSIPLLLISLDGFRADYLERHVSPVLSRLGECGVHAPYIRSIFPTLTFPNHYTIVTGLYAESHGIAGNTMYDEQIGKLFKIGSRTSSNPAWWKGEPIWITAKKQGKRTAAYFWVGSDVNITGIYPDVWFRYDGATTYDTRIDTVLDWVSSPAPDRPDLMLTYFDEPDHEAHSTGPADPKVDAMIGNVDAYIGKLMDGLTTRGLHQCLNIIILADHGMTETSCSREVDYSKLTDTSRFFAQAGTYGHISTWLREDLSSYPQPLPVDSVMNDLHCKSENMKVFTKETVPKRHHILNTNRIGNILLEVQDRWLLRNDRKSSCFLKGNHGFDNIYKSMQALFVAYGPAFKQNVTVDPFENIELYNLMCDVLGIEPAPNNGTKGSLDHLLQNPVPPTPLTVDRGDNCMPVSRVYKPRCRCQSLNIGRAGLAVPLTPHPPQQGPVPFAEVSNSSCLIVNDDYNILYSSTHNAPLYASYILSLDNTSLIFPENISASRHCFYDDPRQEVPTSDAWCNMTNYNRGYLFEPYFSKSASAVGTAQQSTNAIPMLDGFVSSAWEELLRIVVDYARLYGSLSVISGPIWDEDGDGHGDVNHTRYMDDDELIPVPTHFYIVLMKCADNSVLSCDQGGLDIVSFVLPHVDYIPNCLNPVTYLKDNVVRVRDIELLTGLQFFTGSSISQNVAARLRTYLPVTIWPQTYLPVTIRPTDVVIEKKMWMDVPCVEAPDAQCPAGTPPLVLIGLDGFGADFLKKNVTPILDRLRHCGVTSPFMRPVYPTLTFPNMYSIVTGLYPESHGIVANNMYDADLGRFTIRLSGRSDPGWWGGEPIWNTAMKQGKTTASFFWVGSEIKIQGLQPNITKSPYSSSVPFEERVDTVLRWLRLPAEERPGFITLYFNQPDYIVHRQGTQSPETDKVLGRVDGIIGRLMNGLVEMNMHNCVNMIIVADHGMMNTRCDRQVKLNDHLSSSELGQVYVYDGPDGQLDTDYRWNRGIKPNNGSVRPEFYLDKLHCRSPHLRVLEKEDSPVRHHYVSNERIPEILLQSDTGWLVSRKGYRFCSGGNHGWDNMDVHLGSVFMAYGPSVKSGLEIEPFENIELYNLMAELLGIDPAPNNGTQGALRAALRSPPPIPTVQPRPYSACPREAYRASNCCCPAHQVDALLISQLLNETNINSTMPNLLAVAGPTVVSPDLSSVCQLNHDQYITAYNTELQYPVWSLLALPFGVPSSPTLEELTCIYDDPRVPPLPANSCQSSGSSNLTLSPLLPPEFVGNHSQLSTNAVLMYSGFRTGVWKDLLLLVTSWAKFSTVVVTTGPVFDNNHDGLVDSPAQIRNWTDVEGRQLPVASHFFLSLLRCEQPEPGNCSKFGVLSVILPHLDHLPTCWNMTEYIADNVVRLRDIELLTGLQFLSSGLHTDIAVQLRLNLPTELWL